MGRTVPPSTRAEAVADYRASGDPYHVVAKRHGVSRSTLYGWVNGSKHTPRTPREWTDAEVGYYGGWEVVGGVSRPLLPERRSA